MKTVIKHLWEVILNSGFAQPKSANEKLVPGTSGVRRKCTLLHTSSHFGAVYWLFYSERNIFSFYYWLLYKPCADTCLPKHICASLIKLMKRQIRVNSTKNILSIHYLILSCLLFCTVAVVTSNISQYMFEYELASSFEGYSNGAWNKDVLFNSLKLQHIVWSKALVTLDEIENMTDMKMTGLQLKFCG